MNGPDPLAMLEVAEQSRQDAIARREAAVAHLATFALQALVEGHDVREIARRCGFVSKAGPGAAESANHGVVIDGGLFGSFFSLAGAPEPQRSPEQKFADWLSQVVKERIEEAFKVGRPV